MLRIEVQRPLQVAFGRFRGGEPIPVAAGTVVYVGSAMAAKGASSLARRLVRHATRSAGQPAHPIRVHLLRELPRRGLGQGDLRPRAGKRLFWNVDYLLDQPAASLTHVVAIRSSVRLEAALARLLQRDPATFVLAPGLGAADDPGSTHLLEVEGGDTWWAALLPRLEGLVSARQLPD